MRDTSNDRKVWEARFAAFLQEQAAESDAAHDITHIARVVANAEALARAEGARLEVVLPAAWLHDCVAVPKNSPQRSLASRLAARAAGAFLRTNGYQPELIPHIEHAIEAHSFSAGITPQTLEAKVVQDADRLGALGAIGIARCLMLGTQLGRALYHPREPFPGGRQADDGCYTIDHFYTKLLRLAESMTTETGRAEACRRTDFMLAFLAQLADELHRPHDTAQAE